ncbi:hypothetical protein BD410DRAFT_898735 [Rickenella mellea]|uniref:Uncharacterized protein n=1 Tax=Rickenella mellea TaxID=50990 RepID=A0A4Y7Q2X4_9AGAM|nr:hypothetical protein BD410DRAFT_898735 [Rickenella mellea]
MKYTFGLRFLHKSSSFGSKLAKFKALIPAPIPRRTIKNINELPTELLVEIFLCCLPTIILPGPSRSTDSVVSPTVFGMVCRVWHAVSLNTPQLWAHITIKDLYWPWDPPLAWNSCLFDEWLRRSGNCPLSFTIEGHNKDYHAPLTLKLRAEAHRWKSVSLRTNCVCTDDILQTLLIPGKSPMLTDLHILRKSGFKHYTLDPITSQLRAFHVALSFKPFIADRGFYALYELRIGPIRPPQDYSLIFTQFPLLEILEITSKFPPPPTTIVAHTLQHLHTFIYLSLFAGTQLWFLEFLETPTLNSLAIKIVYANRNFENRTYLSNFLMRCGGQLQRLMLQGNFMSCDELVGLTQHTPILESLCAEYSLLLGDMTTLWPKLSNLDIFIPPHMFQKEDIMIAFRVVLSQWRKANVLKRRTRHVSPVIRLTPYKLSVVLEDPKVKKYIRQGLHVAPSPPEEESWWRLQAWDLSGFS